MATTVGTVRVRGPGGIPTRGRGAAAAVATVDEQSRWELERNEEDAHHRYRSSALWALFLHESNTLNALQRHTTSLFHRLLRLQQEQLQQSQHPQSELHWLLLRECEEYQRQQQRQHEEVVALFTQLSSSATTTVPAWEYDPRAWHGGHAATGQTTPDAAYYSPGTTDAWDVLHPSHDDHQKYKSEDGSQGAHTTLKARVATAALVQNNGHHNKENRPGRLGKKQAAFIRSKPSAKWRQGQDQSTIPVAAKLRRGVSTPTTASTTQTQTAIGGGVGLPTPTGRGHNQHHTSNSMKSILTHTVDAPSSVTPTTPSRLQLLQAQKRRTRSQSPPRRVLPAYSRFESQNGYLPTRDDFVTGSTWNGTADGSTAMAAGAQSRFNNQHHWGVGAAGTGTSSWDEKEFVDWYGHSGRTSDQQYPPHPSAASFAPIPPVHVFHPPRPLHPADATATSILAPSTSPLHLIHPSPHIVPPSSGSSIFSPTAPSSSSVAVSASHPYPAPPPSASVPAAGSPQYYAVAAQQAMMSQQRNQQQFQRIATSTNSKQRPLRTSRAAAAQLATHKIHEIQQQQEQWERVKSTGGATSASTSAQTAAASLSPPVAMKTITVPKGAVKPGCHVNVTSGRGPKKDGTSASLPKHLRSVESRLKAKLDADKVQFKRRQQQNKQRIAELIRSSGGPASLVASTVPLPSADPQPSRGRGGLQPAPSVMRIAESFTHGPLIGAFGSPEQGGGGSNQYDAYDFLTQHHHRGPNRGQSQLRPPAQPSAANNESAEAPSAAAHDLSRQDYDDDDDDDHQRNRRRRSGNHRRVSSSTSSLASTLTDEENESLFSKINALGTAPRSQQPLQSRRPGAWQADASTPSGGLDFSQDYKSEQPQRQRPGYSGWLGEYDNLAGRDFRPDHQVSSTDDGEDESLQSEAERRGAAAVRAARAQTDRERERVRQLERALERERNKNRDDDRGDLADDASETAPSASSSLPPSPAPPSYCHPPSSSSLYSAQRLNPARLHEDSASSTLNTTTESDSSTVDPRPHPRPSSLSPHSLHHDSRGYNLNLESRPIRAPSLRDITNRSSDDSSYDGSNGEVDLNRVVAAAYRTVEKGEEEEEYEEAEQEREHLRGNVKDGDEGRDDTGSVSASEAEHPSGYNGDGSSTSEV